MVHCGILELACGDVVVEHQINLSKGAAFRLRQAKPAPDVAQKVGAGIEQTSFGAPIPGWSLGISELLNAFLQTVEETYQSPRSCVG